VIPLVVWKIDRLGRDLKHLVNTIDDLRKREIGFKVLTGHGAQIDTTTSNGRMIFGIFTILAEFERELISERTKAGLETARARGRKGGRPRKMDESTIKMVAAAMPDQKSVATEVAKKLGITTTTLYAYLTSSPTSLSRGGCQFSYIFRASFPAIRFKKLSFLSRNFSLKFFAMISAFTNQA